MHEPIASEPISIDSATEDGKDHDGDTTMDGASTTKTAKTKGKTSHDDPDVVIIDKQQPVSPKTPTKKRVSPVPSMASVMPGSRPESTASERSSISFSTLFPNDAGRFVDDDDIANTANYTHYMVPRHIEPWSDMVFDRTTSRALIDAISKPRQIPQDCEHIWAEASAVGRQPCCGMERFVLDYFAPKGYWRRESPIVDIFSIIDAHVEKEIVLNLSDAFLLLYLHWDGKIEFQLEYETIISPRHRLFLHIREELADALQAGEAAYAFLSEYEMLFWPEQVKRMGWKSMWSIHADKASSDPKMNHADGDIRNLLEYKYERKEEVEEPTTVPFAALKATDTGAKPKWSKIRRLASIEARKLTPHDLMPGPECHAMKGCDKRGPNLLMAISFSTISKSVGCLKNARPEHYGKATWRGIKQMVQDDHSIKFDLVDIPLDKNAKKNGGTKSKTRVMLVPNKERLERLTDHLKWYRKEKQDTAKRTRDTWRNGHTFAGSDYWVFSRLIEDSADGDAIIDVDALDYINRMRRASSYKTDETMAECSKEALGELFSSPDKSPLRSSKNPSAQDAMAKKWDAMLTDKLKEADQVLSATDDLFTREQPWSLRALEMLARKKRKALGQLGTIKAVDLPKYEDQQLQLVSMLISVATEIEERAARDKQCLLDCSHKLKMDVTSVHYPSPKACAQGIRSLSTGMVAAHTVYYALEVSKHTLPDKVLVALMCGTDAVKSTSEQRTAELRNRFLRECSTSYKRALSKNHIDEGVRIKDFLEVHELNLSNIKRVMSIGEKEAVLREAWYTKRISGNVHEMSDRVKKLCELAREQHTADMVKERIYTLNKAVANFEADVPKSDIYPLSPWPEVTPSKETLAKLKAKMKETRPKSHDKKKRESSSSRAARSSSRGRSRHRHNHHTRHRHRRSHRHRSRSDSDESTDGSSSEDSSRSRSRDRRRHRDRRSRRSKRSRRSRRKRSRSRSRSRSNSPTPKKKSRTKEAHESTATSSATTSTTTAQEASRRRSTLANQVSTSQDMADRLNSAGITPAQVAHEYGTAEQIQAHVEKRTQLIKKCYQGSSDSETRAFTPAFRGAKGFSITGSHTLNLVNGAMMAGWAGALGPDPSTQKAKELQSLANVVVELTKQAQDSLMGRRDALVDFVTGMSLDFS